MNDIHFSLLLPTRGRPEMLDRFLRSLVRTVRKPESIEVVIVTDDDDAAMKGYTFSDLSVIQVTVPPGLNMGALNQRAYEASSGANLFLVNDDIIARTPGWDRRILDEIRRYPDGLYLIHVNDLLFESHLCTFPLVSRTYCELAGALCPNGYYRHRIDDHIYNVFNMLAYIGHRRIIYMPDVVFEHDHYTLNTEGKRVYRMEDDIHQPDAEYFEQLLPERKALTLKLAAHAEAFQNRQRGEIHQARLEQLTDAFSIRSPRYIRVRKEGEVPHTENTRVTIGVVSADCQGGTAGRCLDAIKRHTANYELLLLDNNFVSPFNHAADMNRLMAACTTDYLVLMDDDVIVAPGWLEALLSGMDGKTGVATPAHMDRDGDISYAGIVFRPDRSGHHGHNFRLPQRISPIMTMSSAVFIVDMALCGHLRFDETLPKYFLDLDFGLRVWESGASLMLSPAVPVTHIGGATLSYGSEENKHQWEADRRRFQSKWFETGRIDALARTRFSKVADLEKMWRLLGAMDTLFEMLPGENRQAYTRRARRIYDAYAPVPVLNQYVIDIVWNQVKQTGIGNAHDTGKWPVAYLSSLYGRQVPAGKYGDYTLWFYAEQYWGVPERYGKAYIRTLLRMNRPGLLRADRMEDLKAKLDETGPFVPETPAQGRVVEQLNGGVIVAFDNRYMASPTKNPGVPLTPGAVYFHQENARSCILAERPQFIDHYCGHQLYKFHHMYFAAPDLAETDFSNGSHRAKQALRAHTLPQIRNEIHLRQKAEEPRGHRHAVFCTLPPERMSLFLKFLDADPLLIHLPDARNAYPGMDTFEIAFRDGEYPDFDLNRIDPRWIEAFKSREMDAVVIPLCYPDSWRHNLPERLAAQLSNQVVLLDETGGRRSYTGERAQRLQYNKANLCMALQHIDPASLNKVLEVGCADGLACELLSLLGIERIQGIDTSALPHLVETPATVELSRGDATDLGFADGAFDFVFSIAVLEHIPDPARAISEIIRVTAPGGYCYLQTAPLYHSPWGHHMPYFKEPWAHLKHSAAELIESARKNGIARQIKADLNIDAAHYVRGMLGPDHLNGFSVFEYGIEAVIARDDVDVLLYEKTHEGRDLLPEKERSRLWQYTFGELTDHGISLLLKKKP